MFTFQKLITVKGALPRTMKTEARKEYLQNSNVFFVTFSNSNIH